LGRWAGKFLLHRRQNRLQVLFVVFGAEHFACLVFGSAPGVLELAFGLVGLAAASPLMNRATGETVTGASAVSTVNDNDGGAAKDAYVMYSGDGSTKDKWPARNDWASFDSLFTANMAAMKMACGNNQWGADDSATEMANLRTAIDQVATASKVDHRFILAIVMQESEGCVRVPTTNNGVVNPGLMQSHNGAGTCVGQTPCPQSQITQMITDGTQGTSSGDGLAALLNQADQQLHTVDLGRSYYSAARLYNSGSIDWSDLGNGEGSTNCYASDVANRLMGWVLAPSGCTA